MKPVSIKNAEHYKWGDGCHGWHLVKTADLSIIQEMMPPDTSERPHYHKNSNQHFYILAGVATFRLNEQFIRVSENEGLYIPRGHWHQILNEEEAPLEFVVTSQPPSHGDRYENRE